MSDQYIPKILLVDDLKENLLWLEGHLKPINAELFKAFNGAEALGLIEKHNFALMIIDVQMPFMNGYELVEKIHTGFRNVSTPVIFLTAVHYDASSIYKGYMTGAVDYLTKPIVPDILLSKVRVFLELERVNHQLEETKHLYENIINDQTDYILRTNLDLEIYFANSSFLRETSKRIDELKGEKIEHFVYFEDHEKLKSGVSSLGKLEPTIIFQLRMQFGSRVIWANAIIRSNFDHLGNINDYQFVIRDVTSEKLARTELIKALQKAEDAAKSKSSFLANMSHEIRTPLNSIIGMVSLMLKSELTVEQKEDLEVINFSANKLFELVNEVLDFSKIEANQLKLENVPFNIHSEIDKTVKIFQSKAKEKSIELDCNIAPEVPQEVTGDPFRFGQILINIISNAIKFTEIGGIKVTISVVKEFNHSVKLKIIVSDTGIGIPIEEQSHVFDIFTQSNGSIARKFGGTGLGLAITHSLVHMMGGEIGLNSEPGKGSEFWVIIDFDKVITESKPVEKSTDQQNEEINKSLSILVVEDNLLNQKVVCASLRKMGFNPDVAENGRVALEKFISNHYDLIIMDIQMPVMDGLEATLKIREIESSDPKRKKIPIVALTANAMKEDRDKCIAIGMDDYMSKPFKFNELSAILSRILV